MTFAFSFRTRAAVINELPQPLSNIPNSGTHSSIPCVFSALAFAPKFSNTPAEIFSLPLGSITPIFDCSLTDRSADGVLDGVGDGGRMNGLPDRGLLGDLLAVLGTGLPLVLSRLSLSCGHRTDACEVE